MDLVGKCPIRSDKKCGYVLVYKKDGIVETWYHISNLKRLIKFVRNINKKGIKFELYRCSSGKRMDEATLSKLMNIGVIEKEVLLLDDN